MNHRIFALLIISSLILAACHWRDDAKAKDETIDETIEVTEETVQTLAQSNNQFALELYDVLADAEGNLFFSPYSISSAFTMAYAGAAGETADQMAKTLHHQLSGPTLYRSYAALDRDLKTTASESVKLHIANRLWGQTGYNFIPHYLEVTRQYFGAELKTLDFKQQTEQARITINQWIEDQTAEKITNLMPPGSLTEDTRLVLTNAIYFKANWAEQFAPDQTNDAPFYLPSDEPTTVPMMFQEHRYPYLNLPELQVLELPYAGRELVMTVLLPSREAGLATLEAKMTDAWLRDLFDALRPTKVQIWLPRFKMETKYDLAPPMQQLEMRLPFSDKANFSGMNGERNLFLSAAVHKAYVDVNEEGTEAAAATGISVGITAVQLDPIQFRADHPFVFLIRHRPSGAILFIGRLDNPSR